MDKLHIASLLVAIASVDDRFDPDEARVEAWTAILDPDMTLEFARGLMIKHYANNTKPIMPADFNLPWRNFRKEQDDKQWFAEFKNNKKELTDTTRAIIAKGREDLRNKVAQKAIENAPAETG
jgi:hypothetical protein